MSTRTGYPVVGDLNGLHHGASALTIDPRDDLRYTSRCGGPANKVRGLYRDIIQTRG